MSSQISLEDANQKTVFHIHADHVAIAIVYDDSDGPVAVATYDNDEFERLVDSAIAARIKQAHEEWREFVLTLQAGYGMEGHV